MMRRHLAAFAVAALLGLSSGCAESPRQSILFASWSAGRDAPMAEHMLLRVDADRAADVERWNGGDTRWELVCTTPCERSVPAQSTYRLVTPAGSSAPFGLPPEAWSWVFLRLDPDGSVWMVDSPSLRAHRARAALARRWPR